MATARNAISRPETLTEILDTTRMELDYLKERYGVERLAIFGSFAKGRGRKRSDLDILVELRKPLGFDFLRLADHLEQVLGRKVDLATFETMKRSKQKPRYKHATDDIEKTMVYVEAQR
jgi:predicted nucleotidyltransferase